MTTSLSRCAVSFSVLAVSLLGVRAVGAQQQIVFSQAHLDAEQPLAQTISTKDKALGTKLSSGRSAISLVMVDVNGDGTKDLVTGYAAGATGALLVQLGNPRALSPTPVEQAQIAAGGTVTPFVSQANAIDLPVRPDLLAAADIAGFGHNDLVVAAKGDADVYLLTGDGAGNFSAPQALVLQGTISALATWRAPDGSNLIAAGVCGAAVCGVQLLRADGSTAGFAALPGAASAIDPAELDNGGVRDLAVMMPESVMVLDGDTLLSGNVQSWAIPVSGVALTTGLFAYDRRGYGQIAVLDANATLHVFARTGVDNTQATRAEAQALRRAQRTASGSASGAVSGVGPRTLSWSEVETDSNVGPGGSSAVMVSGRLMAGGYDTIAVMSGSEYVTVAHPLTTAGNFAKTTPTLTVDSSSSSTVTAAVVTQLSANSRMGVVAANETANPTYTIPPSYRTMNVNTTADATANTTAESACENNTSGCTLRSAIAVANSDSGHNGQSYVDTINIPAGTYTISATNVGGTYDSYGSYNYHFDVDGSVNFVGAGAGSTIINANNIDKVFSVDSGVVNNFAPFDVFFSGLTIENGTNKNNPASAECGGACDYFGGSLDWESWGPGEIAFDNVVLTGGTIQYGEGGGFFASNSNTSSPNGLSEFINSTVSNNGSPELGGGGFFGDFVPVTLNNDVFSGNTASPSVNTGDSAGSGQGGGFYTNAVSGEGTTFTITATTFSSNTAKTGGGGFYLLGNGANVSQSVFTSNNGGTYGGGMYIDNQTYPVSVTTSTFTGNTLTGTSDGPYTSNGAGICLEAAPDSGYDSLTVHYSRFHGNTNGHNTGLGVGCQSDSGYATANATDNWWGCNGPGSGTGCDTAGTAFSTTAPITLTPYTTLVVDLSATTVAEGQPITATGSMGQDSASTVYSDPNDFAYDGVAATISLTDVDATSTSGSTLTDTAAPTVSDAAITETGTTDATGTGTASVTVDGLTVTANYTVTAPDLTVASSHSGNFKAGDTGDTYTLTASNIGNVSTSGTVTVTDTLPSGFTATALSGTGWSCTLGTLTCTRSDALAASSSYPVITLTVSVSSSDAGSYTNTAVVSGGGETNTSNDTGTDTTIVVGTPTIGEGFSPATVAPNANSTVTVTLGNPAANTVAFTGVAFSDTLPSGLKVSSPSGAATTCSGGTVSATAGGGSISLSGASIAADTTCTVKVNVVATAIGSYTNTTGAITATNSNAGGTAMATLTVSVTPTELAYTTAPMTPITAGGNAGTVTVALEDNAGNIATTNSSTQVTLTVTSTAGYAASYMATASNGVATFSLGSIAVTTASDYTYTATGSGLTQTQAMETVNPGAAASFTVTGLSTFTAPQLSGTATVKALDNYGNLATGFTGTVTLTSTDATATFSPASYTYMAGDAGVHGLSVTFNTAGTFSVTATSGVATGSETGILVQDAIWLLNINDQLARLTDAGVQTGVAGPTTGTSSLGAVAFDHAGDVWATQQDASTIVEYSPAGASIVTVSSGTGGLAGPSTLAIDGLGQIWVSDASSNAVTVLGSAGAAVSPSPGYQAGNLNAPDGLMIDSSGSVWIANKGANTVTKIIGAAAPVITPTVTGATTNTLGTRP